MAEMIGTINKSDGLQIFTRRDVEEMKKIIQMQDEYIAGLKETYVKQQKVIDFLLSKMEDKRDANDTKNV